MTELSRFKSTWISVSILTVIFVAVFFVLRSLPDAECGFLHYVEIVNEDGEIELCATNHAGFLDLSILKYPIQIDLESDEALALGQKQTVKLELETAGGMSMAPHELALTHTEKMHVMIIDASLEDYSHVHPKPVGIGGSYEFEFTPQKTGVYRVFAEVVPIQSRRQAIATGQLDVQGEGQNPKFEATTVSVVDDARFTLNQVPDQLKAGRDYTFSLDVEHVDGGPVALEMVMDAKGHMVAFDSEGTGFAHMHPVNSIAETRAVDTPENDKLTFLFNVPNPGWYRLFAQVQIGGKAVFGRFDLSVE
ncbi:MAG: hypothetical protein ACSHX8_00050 [Opitutaceae bacterium]